jgi:hypothetical protein
VSTSEDRDHALGIENFQLGGVRDGIQEMIEERGQRMKSIITVAAFLVFLLCTEAHAESSFRCGNELVTVGDTTYAVLQECGAPDFREIRVTERIYARRGRDYYDTKIVRVPAGSRYEGVSSGDETWYYDPGPTGFVYVLGFTKSRLSSIKREGYGSAAGIQSWEERKKLAR